MDIAQCPQWIIDKVGAPGKSPPKSNGAKNPIRVNTDSATLAAVQYLQHDAPASIEGANGDDTAFQVAAHVKDLGVPEHAAFVLLSSVWNQHCSPPWSEPELRAKVRNAYAYGHNVIGAESPESDFAQVLSPNGKDRITATPKPKRLRYVLYNEARPRLDIRALVAHTLDENGFSVLYGEPSTGKSFFALNLALSIARGAPWWERRAGPSGVVYVAAEAGASILDRVAAYRKFFEVDDVPFAVVPTTVDLMSANGDAGELVGLIAEAGATLGATVGFIVVDTLSRAMGAGNENATEDMSRFVTRLDRIRELTGAHIMLVHHSGKDRAKGARGSSALRGAVDTEIEVVDRCAYIRKQRNFDCSGQFAFDLSVVDLGLDPDGEPVTSCVVAPVLDTRMSYAEALRNSPATGRKNTRRHVLESLRLAVERTGNDMSAPWCEVATDDWEAEFIEVRQAFGDDKPVNAIARSFRRILSTLISENLVLEIAGTTSVSLNFRPE